MPAMRPKTGEVIGLRQAALQADGEEEQGDADEAADEVRDLDERKRDEAVEDREAAAEARRRSRKEEHRAGGEGGEGEEVRPSRGAQSPKAWAARPSFSRRRNTS